MPAKFCSYKMIRPTKMAGFTGHHNCFTVQLMPQNCAFESAAHFLHCSAQQTLGNKQKLGIKCLDWFTEFTEFTEIAKAEHRKQRSWTKARVKQITPAPIQQKDTSGVNKTSWQISSQSQTRLKLPAMPPNDADSYHHIIHGRSIGNRYMFWPLQGNS